MPKITCVRTIRIGAYPNLLWVEVETDEGLVGLGESFRAAQTIETAIHELAVPLIMGEDAERIEYISRLLTNPVVGFGSSSAEVRAASALDIALWDLKGKRYNTPVYNVLGGKVHDSLPVYNTCSGYSYNAGAAKRRQVTGTETPSGPYDDQIAFMRDAGELARSLLDEGFAAMKIWPFDNVVKAPANHNITPAQLKAGLEPFAKIRQAVGDKIDIMCELHSLWGGTAAARICKALEDYGVFWAEDPLCKNDDIRTLADLRSQTRTPICISETLAGLVDFRDACIANACDFIMVDLAWCGGITMGKKIAAMAEAFSKPLSPHDCTGPVVLFAGIHLAFSAPTAIYQEVVRAYLATWYGEMLTAIPHIANGHIQPPALPGLGIALQDSVKQRADVTIRESR